MSDTADHRPSTAIVGIENLHVILAQQGDGWVAQGLELDYAAGGTSKDDVKSRFELGLIRSIQLHIRQFGNIDRLNIPAGTQVLAGLLPVNGTMSFHSVTIHACVPPEAFPFREISYMIPGSDNAESVVHH